jgi:hypothetical protein
LSWDATWCSGRPTTRALGFAPHTDLNRTRDALGPWQGPSAIQFGRQGKPCYVQGAYDDRDYVPRTLELSAGRGNFHLTVSQLRSATSSPMSRRPGPDHRLARSARAWSATALPFRDRRAIAPRPPTPSLAVLPTRTGRLAVARHPGHRDRRNRQLDTDARPNVDASYRGASGSQGVCWRPASSTPSKRFGRDDRVAALHQFGPRRRRGSGGRLCPIAALRGAVDAEQRSGLLGGAGGVTPFGRLQQSDVLAGRPVQRTSCVNPGRLTGVGARGGQSPHVDRGTSPRTPWRPPSRRWRAAQRRG